MLAWANKRCHTAAEVHPAAQAARRGLVIGELWICDWPVRLFDNIASGKLAIGLWPLAPGVCDPQPVRSAESWVALGEPLGDLG